MLNLKLEGETYPIKNSLDELTIKQFEFISSILNDKEKSHISKWSEIFIYLGLPEDIVENLDSFSFIEIINNFNFTFEELKEKEIVKEIILDGVSYFAYDETFKITVKEMALIEEYVKKNENKYLAEIMAVIYKRNDLQKEMQYDKAHIKHKADLIRTQITSDIAFPIIGFLAKRLIKDFKLIEDESRN